MVVRGRDGMSRERGCSPCAEGVRFERRDDALVERVRAMRRRQFEEGTLDERARYTGREHDA